MMMIMMMMYFFCGTVDQRKAFSLISSRDYCHLLFVWELGDLVMSWNVPRLPKWREKKFSKKSVVVVQKILISMRGGIMG